MANKAEKAQQIRDLKRQVSGIGTEEMTGIEFTMISPGRSPVTIYAVEDGRPVTIPEYMLGPVMTKMLDNGDFMYVADPKDAPKYKMGDIVCFLHVDAPERAIIEEIGLGAIKCRKHTLPSDYAADMHGEHRHKQEWAAYQKFLKDQKEDKRDKRLDEQLEATLSIAKGGSATVTEQSGDSGLRYNARIETVTPTTKGTCDICGKDGLKRVSAHKSMAHKEG